MLGPDGEAGMSLGRLEVNGQTGQMSDDAEWAGVGAGTSPLLLPPWLPFHHRK